MIRIKVEGMDRFAGLSEMFPKAVIRTLAKVGRSTEVKANRMMRDTYNLKRVDVDKMINIHPASMSKMMWKITFSGQKIPIALTSAKENREYLAARIVLRKGDKGKGSSKLMKTGRGRSDQATGTTVEITKGKPLLAKHWFIATMKSGHVGVFVREGKKRLHIHERLTLSIAEMFKQAKILKPITQFAQEKIPEVLAHEVEWEIKNKT